MVKMRACNSISLALIFVLLTSAESGFAQTLDKGHRILLNRGLQSYALSIKDDVFHLSTVQNAGFTGVMWIQGEYDDSLLGAAPGFPWARWASSQADMPPQASPTNEAPYMSNLQAVSISDEQNMNDATTRNNAAAWYSAVSSSFPNTILYSNSWAYEWLDGSYNSFILACNPDMLSMDTYEYVVGNGRTPGGSPYNFYHGLRQLRAFGTGFGKPYQIYTQTYHAGVEGDGYARRNPSDSELRLNYFGGAAFGCTSFVDFTYNTGASALFTSPGGDTTTTPLYATMQDINAKLKKLSPVLTRLQPRTNFISGFDAAMLYDPGQYLDGGTTLTTLSAPDSDFRVYPTDYSTYFAHNNPDWVSVSNSGTFRGITPTNIGTRNNGLRGDVWMMWFKALDESFDGPSANGEIYIVLLNGLSDPTGTGADCRQHIQLNLVNSASTSQLLVLNQQTGQVDTYNVPLDAPSGRRLAAFDVDGGEMVLFKFNTGAPFVGFYATAAENWQQLD